MFSTTFVVFALFSSAFANVFVTSPVASTTFHGGQVATITWQDDGNAPTLQAFGPAAVSIYAGNAQQQTLLQSISTSVDVSTTSSIQFTPNPTIGPNSDEYFIRFQSLSLKDAVQTNFPAEAFSAKFTLDSMTGTFNATVQSQIAGQSTAPIGGSTASSSSSASKVAAATTSAAATSGTTSKSGTSTATGSKASSTSGALGHSTVNFAVAAVAAVFGVALF